MNKFETSSYKTIKSALVNRNLKQALYDEGKVIMDGVLLTLHGEEHRKRRKLEHRVFQRDFFKYYEQELFPKTLNETINPFLKKDASPSSAGSMSQSMSQRKVKLTLHANIHQTNIFMAIKNFCSIEVSKDTLLLSTRHLRRSLPEDNW